MTLIENSKNDAWIKSHGVLGAKSGLEIASDIELAMVCKNGTSNYTTLLNKDREIEF